MSKKLALFGGNKTFTEKVERYNSIDSKEVNAVKKIVESGILSQYLGEWDADFYGGPQVREFEERWSDYFKIKNSIAVNSCTSGLIIALGAIDLQPGDEVIVSPWTMSASATAILVWNAIPVFADIEDETFNLDPVSIEKNITPHTKAIVVTNIFGHPAKIDAIKNIAKKYKLFLIEDAAESLGSYYKNKHTGTFADLGIISFNGNKIITTGGGGIVITNNKKLYQKILSLVELSKKTHPWKFDYEGIGYNLKMPGLNASLGLSQIKHMKKILNLKKKIFSKYNFEFSDSKYYDILIEPKYSKSNYWIQNIKLKKKYSKYINNLLKISNENGFNTRPAWTLLHEQKHFKKFPKSDLSVSKDLHKRIISLPSSVNILNEF